jgi:hypothetical protein
LLRQHSRPSETFFQFFRAADSPALAVVYNADRSQGALRLLFAINPTLGDQTIAIGADVPAMGPWRQMADPERFFPIDTHAATLPVEAELFLPGLGCGLWVSDG